jgi:dipeptidyl aminopeptidase/acylaminoacyl peptidase
MKPLKRFLILLIAFVAPLCHAQNALTPELLWQLKRVSGPTVSPDGRDVVFGMTRYDLVENRGNTDLYLVPVEGGPFVQLTDFTGSEVNPQWRPDGEKIGFLSARGGSMQLWEIGRDGTGLRQVSNIAGGISNFRYDPSGRLVSFTADVRLDRSPAEIYPDLPRADARIIDDLLYRHWDAWHDYTYSHLFVAEYRNSTLGEPLDLMPNERHHTPLKPFGGLEQIGWSPDGHLIAYTSKKMTGAEAALSTNSDIYIYDLRTQRTWNLTDGMPGYDVEPAFSPDGRHIAWLSMERDGYESDRNRLFVYDIVADRRRELTGGFDQNAHSPTWSADGQSLYFTSETLGTIQLFVVNVNTGRIRQITEGQHDYGAFGLAESGSQTRIIASRVSMSAPADLYRVDPESGAAVALTSVNEALLGRVGLGRVEQRMIPATDGEEILTWVIYPPDFDPSRTYPALLYGQGGPQSTVSQFFSYRWNFQLMAAHGYIVVAPNRRGLPSFGQAWNEQISGDWGGQAMQDLLSAIDAVAAEPFVDETRLGAVGASFGGYSVFWLAGHHGGRFKTFIAHAGVFNLESMYGATEELFFVNFDLEGPYWQSPRPASYEAFSPHRFVQHWDTPMLVIHGQKDFRVPVTEGMQAFTALQARGIESRFLYFPEEGHWIQSPQNSVLWHRVFYDWLARYLK